MCEYCVFCQEGGCVALVGAECEGCKFMKTAYEYYTAQTRTQKRLDKMNVEVVAIGGKIRLRRKDDKLCF